ncbi:MAG: BamA/TamA family outer membrane protein [Gemmatimonadetes bacterium]|nr:BamA/TamA family outer membrane protein [Gemmatimonadota bacterium]
MNALPHHGRRVCAPIRGHRAGGPSLRRRGSVGPLRALSALASMAAMTLPVGGRAQSPAHTGLEVAGVPALNYDADEGFGYGVIAELYQYGRGGAAPYRYTLQPTLFLTTGGRRDVTLFFDAPHVLPGGWRLDAFLGSEKQIATPFYGTGNDAPYDPSLESDQNPYYYRFGRTRRRAEINVQHTLFDRRLRALMGVGAAHTDVIDVPKGVGTTYLADLGTGPDGGWSNHVRVGLVWDSRDRETGPRRGTWSDILLQRVDPALGSDWRYTRWTLTDRRYFSISRALVFANRFVLQGVSGSAPFYDLQVLQTSFKQQEGLGGAKTLRGVLKNRYTGDGLFLWNAELRWEAVDFSALGKDFHTVLSGFVDSGRVWSGSPRLSQVFRGLHRGIGGGVRLVMGENFVVAVDAGTGAETGMPLYIGLGYLY